jgi:hypothetical protein
MRTTIPAAALAVALGLPGLGHAQAIWNPSFPQSWAPGAYQPQNELSFSHRYNYYAGPAWYLGMNGRQASYLEYLDRVDRAERLGYPCPLPPALLTMPPRRWRKRYAEPAPPAPEEAIELAPPPQPVRVTP